MSDVTRIIRAIAEGRAEATDDLLPAVYRELRRMAAARLAREAGGHTLQPTALVHEAYMRLVGPNDQSWQNRSHFFGAAAEAMRRILIDHARGKKRIKRGGAAVRVTLDDIEDDRGNNSDDLLALDEALSELELLDPKKAQLVKLKFFGGMATHEAAKVLGLSQRTAERNWAYARVWLHRHVKEDEQ
jgi:RNA polymerase sigma factor (TIGR02999 family)